MLYSLFEYLNKTTDLPGMRVVEYISFRSAAAIIISLLIAIVFGKRIIRFLKRKQIGEDVSGLFSIIHRYLSQKICSFS
ncbi:MAG: hypothetical protein J6R02_03540, partial [Alistipes sp.]|nr:hypothetical protein [Alistipes sp.]